MDINYEHQTVSKKAEIKQPAPYMFSPFVQRERATDSVSYYYAGSERIAMKSEGKVYYLFSDHLGSTTTVVERETGRTINRQLYHPWGTTRYSYQRYGEQATDYGYTGQMQVDDIYYYNARWPQVPEAQRVGFDPAIGRFMQADTLVPPHQGTQGFDRYAYINNNPVNGTDPTGMWMCGDMYDPGCAENAYERALYRLGTYDLISPSVITNWNDIKDDPIDLLARAVLQEQTSKLNKDYLADAIGVAWVIRNRHDIWYNPANRGNFPSYSKVKEDERWLRAATGGIYGMEQNTDTGTVIGRGTNIQANFLRFGSSVKEAVFLYNVAWEVGFEVFNADLSADITDGATAFVDAYMSGNEMIWFHRTHFWVYPDSSGSHCAMGVTDCR